MGGLRPGGGSLSKWGSLSRGSLSREVSVQGGLCKGDPHIVTNGRYASYLNAFLLFLRIEFKVKGQLIASRQYS